MALPQRVWMITGASQGLGRELVLAAIARGDKAIATGRNLQRLQELERISNENQSGTGDVADRPSRGECRALQLDITADVSELKQKAATALSFFGRVDVLVNNVGRGMVGVVEEMGFNNMMKQFMLNFFGPINVTNAILPNMRERRSGTIVFIGSRSSWRARFPMLAPYAASKAALDAAAESLKAELAPFNIGVLTVLPGGLRTTNWQNTNVMPVSPDARLDAPAANVRDMEAMLLPSLFTEASSQREAEEKARFDEGRIEDYATQRAEMLKWMHAQDGVQYGDPAKAAKAIIDVVCGEGLAVSKNQPRDNGDDVDFSDSIRLASLPELLVLGEDAEENIRERCLTVLRCLDEWKDVTRSIAHTK
ncbi:NAD(P)-binding protein [Obba rivulosa]|uniref:NAD(P)-binding protein n=1 Tax=Obba rivulosa TaxID=1052685 RepID=A0A8E2APH3_9APHY|nr:NAD(P)-binding protein [Obba rivulosa]